MIQSFITFAASVGTWAYLVLALQVFAEDALFFGFVLPAETVLVLCAFLAQQHALNVWLVFAIAAVAAVLGDQAGFEIGHRFGPGIKQSRLGRRIGESSWAAAENLLEERGGYAVFLGRWIAFLRALVPTTSGLLRMRWGEFTKWNALGGVAWAAAWTAVGFTAGASWETAAKKFGEISSAIVLVLAFAGILIWRRRRAKTHAGKP